MEHDYWHGKWQQNDIGFHEGEANDLLVDQFMALSLSEGARIFVPLCGKTRDIAWLLARGYHVIGAELSRTAIEQLFDELGLKPKITEDADIAHFTASKIDIFVGDVFDLSSSQIGPIDAVYDRAALVALPSDLRERYAAHVAKISKTAPQLLICFEYPQEDMSGPPFSISADELARVHGGNYKCSVLTQRDAQVRGTAVSEVAWHLM